MANSIVSLSTSKLAKKSLCLRAGAPEARASQFRARAHTHAPVDEKTAVGALGAHARSNLIVEARQLGFELAHARLERLDGRLGVGYCLHQE